MAAQEWSPTPNLIGKCTEEHFEIVSIPPKLKPSEENVSWSSSITSSVGAKLNTFRKPNSITHPCNHRNPNCICCDITPQGVSPNGSWEPTSNHFHSANSIASGGNLVMRVSTESSRRILANSTRSLTPVQEQSRSNTTIEDKISLTPTPSVISTIIDSEFVAHKHRKQKKYFRHKFIAQPSFCFSYNHKVPKRKKSKTASDEKFKIKIEHHRNMEPTQRSKDSLRHFKRKVNKLLKPPSLKYSGNSSLDRRSTFSFQSANDIVSDEYDFLKKNKGYAPVESFSLLPSSDEEYESSESLQSTKSYSSVDEDVRKHRERCEQLLKEAEKLKCRYESEKCDPSKPFYCIAAPPIYYVELSEGNNINVREQIPIRPDNAKIKVNNLTEKELPIPNQVNNEYTENMVDTSQQVKNSPILVDKKTSPIAENIDKEKLEELSKRLSDWKSNKTKLQKEPTKTVEKKKIKNKPRSKTPPGCSRENGNKADSVKKTTPKKLQENFEHKVACINDLNQIKRKNGVLSKVIPSWLRFFSIKKTREEQKMIKQEAEMQSVATQNKSVVPVNKKKRKDTKHKS